MRSSSVVCAIAGAYAFLTFVLIGCGQTPSQLASVKQPEHVLLAIMGGNTSCSTDDDGNSSPQWMGMTAPFNNLRKKLEESGQYTVSYFLSCHNSDAAVHYAASDDPTSIHDTDFTGTKEKIDQLYESTGAQRLIVAGHSYGGWLAMMLGASFSERLSALITIDPISRVTCSFMTPAGCLQAPTDISHSKRLDIKGNADVWINFWQDRTFYLHSSTMNEADFNYQEQAEHTDIDSHDDVWQKFGKAVKGAFTDLATGAS